MLNQLIYATVICNASGFPVKPAVSGALAAARICHGRIETELVLFVQGRRDKEVREHKKELGVRRALLWHRGVSHRRSPHRIGN